jgi:2-keto-4-pentenoate hydratase/2-oxohepta-3-ene-1,7-dioic acid hydratase in catechol pathway
MKIIGIGRNYAKHIKEMGNKPGSDPIVFLMPDSAVLRNNDAFYFPDYSQEVHYEVELVIRISKVGKNIEEKFAHNYYQEIALGIDFTARDLQARFKKEGLPWTLAKGFNGSAPISRFFPKNYFGPILELDFSLKKNDELVQSGNPANMIYSIDELIAFCSKYMTLKKGDLIFTGTPEGVGPVKIGDRLSGYISDQQVLDFEIR